MPMDISSNQHEEEIEELTHSPALFENQLLDLLEAVENAQDANRSGITEALKNALQDVADHARYIASTMDYDIAVVKFLRNGEHINPERRS